MRLIVSIFLGLAAFTPVNAVSANQAAAEGSSFSPLMKGAGIASAVRTGLAVASAVHAQEPGPVIFPSDAGICGVTRSDCCQDRGAGFLIYRAAVQLPTISAPRFFRVKRVRTYKLSLRAPGLSHGAARKLLGAAKSDVKSRRTGLIG